MATVPRELTFADEVHGALEAGRTIPARWYADPEIYRLEYERIFQKSWMLLAPESQVAKPGDRIIGQAGLLPVVVTRTLDGELRGFVNICRHRAHPVALENGNQKSLQCQYHGWTYNLDGTLRAAPRCNREANFDFSELSLVPVAVDTWRGFVFVNPDASAAPVLEGYPELEEMASQKGLDFTGYEFENRWTYQIPSNWKVWVENATECYHCPTVHKNSFSDAYETGFDEYELVETGRLLCQFAHFNQKGEHGKRAGSGDGFRFIYMWPTTFWAQDDFVAFTGMIIPTGVETCDFVADVFIRPGVDRAFVDDWMEMWNQTLTEDAEAVRVQQPGLRSGAVPYGRLLPRSESPIVHFHKLVAGALTDGG